VLVVAFEDPPNRLPLLLLLADGVLRVVLYERVELEAEEDRDDPPKRLPEKDDEDEDRDDPLENEREDDDEELRPLCPYTLMSDKASPTATNITALPKLVSFTIFSHSKKKEKKVQIGHVVTIS
jgi:hypothetical protein